MNFMARIRAAMPARTHYWREQVSRRPRGFTASRRADRHERLAALDSDPWTSYRSNAAFKALVRAEVDATAGAGVMPRAATGQAMLDRRLDELWMAWTADASVDGRPWSQICRGAVECACVDGEAYLLLADDGRVQALTARQVPEIHVDPVGRPLDFIVGDERQTVPATDMLVLLDRLAPDDVRGTSRYEAGLRLCEYESNFSRSELRAATAASRIAFSVVRDAAAQQAASDYTDDEAGVSEGTAREVDLGDDVLIFDSLSPGEKVEVASSNRPASTWPEFRGSILRQAAASVGADPAATTGESMDNYSAARALRLNAEQAMKARHVVVSDALWRPLWRWLVVGWMRSGAVSIPEMYLHAALHPSIPFQPLPAIDPGRQATADKTRLESGTVSRAELIRESGRDPETVSREVASERPAQPPARGGPDT